MAPGPSPGVGVRERRRPSQRRLRLLGQPDSDSESECRRPVNRDPSLTLAARRSHGLAGGESEHSGYSCHSLAATLASSHGVRDRDRDGGQRRDGGLPAVTVVQIMPVTDRHHDGSPGLGDGPGSTGIQRPGRV